MQGDAELLMQLDSLRAQQAKELEQDLRAMDKAREVRPPFYPTDPLHQETQARIEHAKQEADRHATASVEKLKATDPGYGPSLEHLKAEGASPYQQMTVAESFTERPALATPVNDLSIQRYYGGQSKVDGNFWTTEQFSTPAEAKAGLALPEGNTADQVATDVVPRGQTYLVGTAAPKFGQPGGAEQIYVPNFKAPEK
jgi:hypothetical protein